MWLRVVAAVVLGDLVWGVLRRYVSASAAGAQASARFDAFLPYAQPHAPISAFVRELSLDSVDWRGALAGALLALGGGLLLGPPAFVLSVAAVLLTVVAWALARRGDTPAASFSLLDVFLPFALGLTAAGWSSYGGMAPASAWQPLLVAAAFTVLQWGVLQCAAHAEQRRAVIGLAFGALAVLVVQVGLGMPFAAGVSAVLLAPALYWLNGDPGARGRSAGTPAATGAWAAPWLMLALFVASLALR
jgi:hypothetical protein